MLGPRGARLPGRGAPRLRVARSGAQPGFGVAGGCRVLGPGGFDGLDLVPSTVDDPLSVECPRGGAAVRPRRNSAAFRMDAGVPLVVAEVNPADVAEAPKGIVSNPNCTTMVLVTALAPLHRAAGIDRMVVSSYQSVSGAGWPGIHELDDQWTKLDGRSRLCAGRGPDGVIVGRRWPKPSRQRDPLADESRTRATVGGVEARPREQQDPARSRPRRDGPCVAVPVFVGHPSPPSLVPPPMGREDPSSCSPRRRRRARRRGRRLTLPLSTARASIRLVAGSARTPRTRRPRPVGHGDNLRKGRPQHRPDPRLLSPR